MKVARLNKKRTFRVCLNAFYKQRRFKDDDFDWDNYTRDSYARRINDDIESEFVTRVEPGHVEVYGLCRALRQIES